MTKSKFSGSSIVVSSIFVIQLVNGSKFFNATSDNRLQPANY